MTIRKGKTIGFRSLGAEGRILQAVRSPTEPHRVVNYNFGSWESWELSAQGLVNVAWQHKGFGLQVQELRIMTLDDVRSAERQHLQATRELQSKLRESELELHDCSSRLVELMDACQQQACSFSEQMEGLGHKLRETCQRRDVLEQELQRSCMAFEQLQGRLAELEQERDEVVGLLECERRTLGEVAARAEEAEAGHYKEVMQLRGMVERLRGDAEEAAAESRVWAARAAQAEDPKAQGEKERALATELAELQAASSAYKQTKEAEVKLLQREREELKAALEALRMRGGPGCRPSRHPAPLPLHSGSSDVQQRHSAAPSCASNGQQAPLCGTSSSPTSRPLPGHQAGVGGPSTAPLMDGLMSPAAAALMELVNDTGSPRSGMVTPRLVFPEDFQAPKLGAEEGWERGQQEGKAGKAEETCKDDERVASRPSSVPAAGTATTTPGSVCPAPENGWVRAGVAAGYSAGLGPLHDQTKDMAQDVTHRVPSHGVQSGEAVKAGPAYAPPPPAILAAKHFRNVANGGGGGGGALKGPTGVRQLVEAFVGGGAKMPVRRSSFLDRRPLAVPELM